MAESVKFNPHVAYIKRCHAWEKYRDLCDRKGYSPQLSWPHGTTAEYVQLCEQLDYTPSRCYVIVFFVLWTLVALLIGWSFI